MPHHRENAGSVSVHDLLGADAVAGTRPRTRSRTGDRVKLAVGAAVAAGALIGSATQLAHASTLLPVGPRVLPATDTTVLYQGAGHAKPVAAPQAQPIADPAAPFGLQHLPAELSGPLSQAEQAIEGLHQQFAPPVTPQTVRPVYAAPVSSGFGPRWGSFHSGLDFAAPIGTPIRSVANGTVIDAGPASGFGQWVRVAQDDGHTAVYGHVEQMLVHQGQRVTAGQDIATVGNRGESTGPHLHLEIWDPAAAKIDPAPYLVGRGVVLGEQAWGPGE